MLVRSNSFGPATTSRDRIGALGNMLTPVSGLEFARDSSSYFGRQLSTPVTPVTRCGSDPTYRREATCSSTVRAHALTRGNAAYLACCCSDTKRAPFRDFPHASTADVECWRTPPSIEFHGHCAARGIVVARLCTARGRMHVAEIASEYARRFAVVATVRVSLRGAARSLSTAAARRRHPLATLRGTSPAASAASLFFAGVFGGANTELESSV